MEVDWASRGRGYSKLLCGLIQLLLTLPFAPGHPSLFNGNFSREMDLVFPGFETLGNLDPSQSGPRLPVGFAIGGSVHFC